MNNNPEQKLRIWKCDSKWGNGPRVLDLFADYRCVFFGTDGDKVGHYWDVSPNDLIAISRGTKIVAIAEARTKFNFLKEMSCRITVPRAIRAIYDYDNGSNPVGCEISEICWLDKPIINDRRGGRFFELGDGYNEVLCAWEEFMKNPKEKGFDIKSFTVSLCGEEMSIFRGERNRYVIPVYQRPYAWGEEQIERLLEDIKEAFVRREKMFVGTIQVSAPIKVDDAINSFYLIDGQQRLTTLLMLLKELNVDYTNKLRTVVDNGAAQRYWDDYRDWANGESIDENVKKVNPYINAAQHIKKWLAELPKEDFSAEDFSKFIEANLCFVVIEMQASISKTLEIFNVINTAGMDLNTADVFKLNFFEYLSRKKNTGESIFQQIAECYKQIEDRNRSLGMYVIGMDDVLACYQRIIVAKFDMNADVYQMSSSHFFERLFDALLNGRNWKEFLNSRIELKLDDLQRIVGIMLQIEELKRTNSQLRVMCNFVDETRYSWYAKYMLAVACYFHVVQENNVAGMVKFNEMLFKRLVPASIGFGKVVNSIRTTKLLELLKAMAKGKEDMTNSLLSSGWDVNGIPAEGLIDSGLNQEIAMIPRWKNLLCRLAEYLITQEQHKDTPLKEPDWQALDDRLFHAPFDVEHIQAYTDREDCENVWKDWEEEINKLGNLSLLEYSINRSIKNEAYATKRMSYKKSSYESLRKVAEENSEWSKNLAVTRRKQLADMIKNYLFSEQNSL